MAFATAWLAIMASVIGRRPKGVVVICVCIFFHLSLGKRNQFAESAPGLLTVIREFAILRLLDL
jgi:hypothetical protein